MFKLFSDFFGSLLFLFILLSPIFLFVGPYLIWRGSGTIRVLGCLILLLATYYRISWISPWYVLGGGERVEEFQLSQASFGSSPSVEWMEASERLLLVPDKRSVSDPNPPNVLVVDLETQEKNWLPTAKVNIDEAITVKYFRGGYKETFDDWFIYYTSPSKLGPRFEYSFIGFSLPILVYNIPWIFSEGFGWKWEKTYLGWERLVVRESESASGVVELNKIVFNAPSALVGIFNSAWVLEGKFLILSRTSLLSAASSYSDPSTPHQTLTP